MNKRFLIAMVLLTGIFLTGFPAIRASEANSQKQEKEKMKLKPEAGISGLVFFKTLQLEQLKDFYINQVGASLWMDQGNCIILRHGNFLFGFCQRDKADLDALITFFYEKKEDVDRAYDVFKDIAVSPPIFFPGSGESTITKQHRPHKETAMKRWKENGL